jgi:hypothetical protein
MNKARPCCKGSVAFGELSKQAEQTSKNQKPALAKGWYRRSQLGGFGLAGLFNRGTREQCPHELIIADSFEDFLSN